MVTSSSCASARGLVDWSRVLSNALDVIFVQIGANVGPGAHDAVFSHAVHCGWRGVAIEPVPMYREKLVSNYERAWAANKSASPEPLRVHFLSQAVADYNGTSEIVVGLGGRQGEASRLVRNTHGWLRGPVPSTRKVSVNVTTLERVWSSLKGHVAEAASRVDLLVVDAEGEEVRILSRPLPHPRPTFVLYEHKHLSFKERGVVSAALRKQGYALLEHPGRPAVCPRYEVCHVTSSGKAHGGDLLYGLGDIPAGLGKHLQRAPAGWRSPIGFF